MFCDLVGSTQLSHALDPEDYGDVMNEYRKACDQRVKVLGGHIAQWFGDGMLVYFGFPLAFEDAPNRAVSAALDVLESIDRVNQSLEARFHVKLAVRIGIHAGLVVLERGDAGRERLAVGDTPNVAARLQALAQPNCIVISAAVESSIRGRFAVQDAGVHQLQGVSQPMRVFRVTGRLSRPMGTRERALSGRLDFIGREGEFEILRLAWESVVAGSSAKVALIRGEPGIGKSRLAEELSDYVRPSGKTIEFRCSPISRRSPLRPLVETIGQALNFATEDSTESRRAKLMDGLKLAGLDNHLSLFETLLFPGEFSSPQPPPTPNPESWKTLQSALLSWLRSQVDRPTLILWEDVHWIDSLSSKLLGTIQSELSDLPVFLLVTSREEVPLGIPGDTTTGVELHLEPLTTEQSSQLIDNVVEEGHLPQGIKGQLMVRGEGIPLFLTELTRMFLDVRAPQVSSGGGSTAGAAMEPSIPASLQDLLLARLDRLTRKTALCFAAALGRECDYDLLGSVSGLVKEELDAELGELLMNGILIQRNVGARPAYVFSHALFQEAAYNSMLRSSRRSVHARIGDVLSDMLKPGESLGGAKSGELVSSLAYHWSRSVDRKQPDFARVEKAAASLIQSADLQLAIYGYSESESQLIEARELLELIPVSPRRGELELGVEVRLSTVFKVRLGWASQEVKAAYDRSYELCMKLGNRPELAQVLFGQWSFYLGQGRVSESLTAALEIAKLANGHHDTNFAVQAYAALANSQFWLCRLEECVDSAERGLQRHSEKFLDADLSSYGQDPRIHALQSLTWSLWHLGRAKTAQRRCAEMIELAEAVGHPFGLANALLTKCNLDLLRRDHAGVVAACARLQELSARHGFLEYTFRARLFQGWCSASNGDSAEVLEEVGAAYESYKSHGGVARTLAAWAIADIFRSAGRHLKCLEILEEALASWTHEEVVYEAALLWMKGKVIAEHFAGEQAEAEAVLNRSIELARARGQVPFVIRSAVELYRLEHRSHAHIELPKDLLQEYLRRFEGEDEPDFVDASILVDQVSSQ